MGRSNIELREAEQKQVEDLYRLITVAGKRHSHIIPEGKAVPSSPPKRPSFNNRIHYFYKEVDKNNKSYEGKNFKTELELTAFLTIWLSRYIFPVNPQDGVSRWVFPLALKLDRGISFGLAHSFLGTLNEHQD
ncbi:PMD domain-containing protein [Cephalotus follicularis]|uniref:PMD domain-containing protein n=1 Tax=Cephalotus follicularis TaxID=3775 RepID=A0A1Q3CZV8_CEPFO|nr:PMD domain-containing protein [Cephalotus follicularis]